MKRSVTANAGKDYTCHVGDAGSSPACLATGSSVTGSTPALRSDVFSISRRRDASTEISRLWRMPEGLHRIVSARSRVRVPPGPSMRARSSVGRAGRLSKNSSPQLEYSGGNAGRDHIFVWIERRPCHSSSRHRYNAGECRWDYIG